MIRSYTVISMSNTKSLLCTLALSASGLLAQAPGPPPLMHLHPIALDASGQAVTDLTAAAFKIVDQGKPQTIFSFNKPAVGPAAPLGLLEFTNRAGGTMPHTTAILFDMINMIDSDRLDAWKALDKSLPQLESGENIYFYLLNLEGAVVPIHAIGPRSADDKTWPQRVADVFDKVMKASSHARPLQLGAEDQVKKADKALEDIGNQLMAFPGRRDILWITNGLTTVADPKLPNCNGDWVECTLYVPHLGVTLEKEGVAVDPYAFIGNISPDVNYNLEQMALLTGGHSYFREDVRAVLKQIAQNAVDSYSIAYDPQAENWDSKWHRIHLTCERKGVKLQVRERYYALPDTRSATDRMKAALIAAFQSPSDSADIGLRVKIASMEGDKKGVHLEVRIQPTDIMFSQQGDKFTGAVYFLISDRSATATLGEPSVSSFNLELTAAQHDTVMKEGVPLSQDHPTTDAVAQVRVIILDQKTDAVGSVTVPVK